MNLLFSFQLYLVRAWNSIIGVPTEVLVEAARTKSRRVVKKKNSFRKCAGGLTREVACGRILVGKINCLIRLAPLLALVTLLFIHFHSWPIGATANCWLMLYVWLVAPVTFIGQIMDVGSQGDNRLMGRAMMINFHNCLTLLVHQRYCLLRYLLIHG